MGVPGSSPPPALPDLPPAVVAIGWACVELDRAAMELAPLLPDGERFEEADASLTLGARCRAAHAGDAFGGILVVLLEPATEGRLAAFLARFGEGWAADWIDVAAEVHAASRPPTRLGPVGPERLLGTHPASGRFRLLVETATIER